MQAAPVLDTPKVAGRYTIMELLGTGGMAKVYRAQDESLGRTIALKRLTSTDASAAALFEAEYHTLAGLRHPSIIEVFDYGVDAEGPYYTMELLEGSDAVGLAPMPWPLVCECLREVGGALALIHRRELVHRDISPRNVWRTAGGDFKVLDFGALTGFGVPKEVVGTPAFMAPEAVIQAPLDQRADLYSLGAVAYFLLTGRRATSPRSLEDVGLPQPKPAPPSALVTVSGSPIQTIPAELDELVLSMLSRTPLARPASAAEVIERACTIAGLTAESHSRSSQPQLVSAEFVGREPEAKLLAEAVAQLRRREGAAVLVEGPPGQGKSRLLRETKLDAGLTGVTVLSVEARLHPGLHGAAIHLAKSLVESLPELARELARSHAGILAYLSPELRDILGYTGPSFAVPSAPGEVRMRVQEALFGWFTAVSARREIAVFVDDVDELDDPSGAFVAALSRAAKQSGMLIVASTTERPDRTVSDPMKVMRASARTIGLEPLELGATRSLLRSAFGDVPNLPRLAEKLHERSGGNPQQCMDLVLYLVRNGVIDHRAGLWILPQELRGEELPDTPDAVLARRFDRLSSTAKKVARVLALHGGLVSVDMMCALLDEEPPGRISMAADELLRENVATGSRSGFRLVARFAPHTGSVNPAYAASVHRKLAATILSRGELTPVERIEAGFHLVRAGEPDRGGGLLARGAMDVTGEPEGMPAALATLEAALRVYKQDKRPAAELAPLLAALASASYYVDHRLAGRYGEEAVTVLKELVGLDVAARFRRFLGKRLSVILGVVVSAVRLRRLAKGARAPNLQEAFVLFFSVMATLTGVHVIYVDRAAALRHAMLLEPLTALGKNHVASFMYEFTRCLVMTIENTSDQARQRWRRLLERLRSNKPIRAFPANRRQLYEAGALYALGVIESWADGPTALRIAEELDSMGMKLYAMSADQVRALHYANQGKVERFQHYRERVETHAIQRGTAWQVEIWWHSALIATHLRGHDAMGMKHTRDVLERLAGDIPSLSLYAGRAAGAYAVMRGRQEEGIAVLEASRKGGADEVVGAHRTLGLLARAYNMSGNPARAKELCLDALSVMSEGDRELVAMNQIVLTELAMAEARLGNLAAAERWLDALLEKHLPLEGPLTLGGLFEARAAVALLQDRRDTARSYLEQMTSWYEKTGLPSLAARAESLLGRLARPTDVLAQDAILGVTDDDSETVILRDP